MAGRGGKNKRKGKSIEKEGVSKKNRVFSQIMTVFHNNSAMFGGTKKINLPAVETTGY